MISVSLGPEWPRARERLINLKTISPRLISAVMSQGAKRFFEMLVEGIETGKPGGKPAKALEKSTLATRRLRKRSGNTPLSDRGHLARGVKMIRSTNSIFVGIPANARGDRGRPLLPIALAQEFGAGPTKITISPAMRRFFAILAKESGHVLGSSRRGRDKAGRFRGKGTKGVLVIRTRKRPFLAPTARKFQAEFKKTAPIHLKRLLARR